MPEEPAAEHKEWAERYRPLVDASPDAIFVLQDNRHVFANARGLALLGVRSLADLHARPSVQITRPSAGQRAVEGDALEYVEEQLVRPDGTVVDVETAVATITFEDRPAALVVARDITNRKRAEAAREAASARVEAPFARAPVGMAVLSADGRLLKANQSLADLLGREVYTLPGTAVASFVHLEDRARLAGLLGRLMRRGLGSEHTEVRLVRADGLGRWALTSASATGDPAAPGLLCLTDISDRKTAEAELTHHALHDPLTGLPNRVLFLDRLDHALARRRRDPVTVAVLFLDLDGFKAVNDKFSHRVGDQLLVTVADRLRSVLRPTDTLARFGGDEFALLLDRLSEGALAVDVAERIVATVAPPVELEGTEISVSASIGVAYARREVDDAADLLAQADAAMYEAKGRGTPGWAVYGG